MQRDICWPPMQPATGSHAKFMAVGALPFTPPSRIRKDVVVSKQWRLLCLLPCQSFATLPNDCRISQLRFQNDYPESTSLFLPATLVAASFGDHFSFVRPSQALAHTRELFVRPPAPASPPLYRLTARRMARSCSRIARRLDRGRALAPSLLAAEGLSWTSIKIPSMPAATAARLSKGMNCGSPPD